MYEYIKTPVAKMYAEPTSQAEVVSEALFSEQVIILKESGEWRKVETVIDQYSGWINASSLLSRNEPFLSEPQAAYVMVNRAAAHFYEQKDIIYGPALTLPYESRIELINDAEPRWIEVRLPNGEYKFVQRGDVLFNPSPLSRVEICNLSKQFLGLPYTWGGRSSFGYDCSGFVQMLYRRMGVFLPRDSKTQYLSEKLCPIDISQIRSGDLIFFGHNKEKVCHVGLYLGQEQFIHTSTVDENVPYLRINHLNEAFWNGQGYFSFLSAKTLSI
jgi:gamma-D-glutamyl-L-lysine dipeptidyl-peptidase